MNEAPNGGIGQGLDEILDAFAIGEPSEKVSQFH
jgi:hypothetical protein